MLHTAIATAGCMLFGGIFLNLLHIRAYGPHYFTILFLRDVPYSPAFWGSALVAGFVQTRINTDRVALWLGPIALFLFALLILLSIPGYLHSSYELAESNHSFIRYTWGELFSVDHNCPSDECLGKFMFTAPVLNCIAYSVGAWLSTRKG
jgi:hypothetical protein